MSKLSRISKQKASGAHFTPPDLARLVACRLLEYLPEKDKKDILVLDPACGDGELLLEFARCCSEEMSKKIRLIGVEEDKQSLQEAQRRLSKSMDLNFELILGDFLGFVTSRIQDQGLFAGLFDDINVPTPLERPADIIIANPPYVRTQVLGAERSQELARIFDLSGRVDLYHAFMVAMTQHLAPGGLLGVITSNRFLTTKGGATLRKFLASEYEIVELLDLGDTKLFEAAVLPALFFGIKKSDKFKLEVRNSKATQFVRIYERQSNNNLSEKKLTAAHSIYDVLEKPVPGHFLVDSRVFDVAVGDLTIPQKVSDPWMMVNNKEKSWLEQIDQKAICTIAQVAEVRVGIKTTADEVFIRKDWEDLPDHLRPEGLLLQSLISREDIDRWIPKSGTRRSKVLYTHEIRNGNRAVIEMANFPKAMAYLEKHRQRLESRKYVIEANRRWYEIWVPQDPAVWKQPKIIFPDISPEPKFSLDLAGSIVDGNCYWITLRKNVDSNILYLIQGLANSKLMTKYHDLAFNNKLYSGRRRYMTQYVEKYPIPDPNSLESRKIIALVREIVYQQPSPQRLQDIESEIEGAIANAFEVDTNPSLHVAKKFNRNFRSFGKLFLG